MSISMSISMSWSRSWLWLNKQYNTANNNTRGLDHGLTSYTTTAATNLPAAAMVVVAKQTMQLPRINRGRRTDGLIIKKIITSLA